MSNFIENVFELAFGDDAVNKGYSLDEVYQRLKYFCEMSHEWEEFIENEAEHSEYYANKLTELNKN